MHLHQEAVPCGGAPGRLIYDDWDQFHLGPKECVGCGAGEPEYPVEEIYLQAYITEAAELFE